MLRILGVPYPKNDGAYKNEANRNGSHPEESRNLGVSTYFRYYLWWWV